MIPKQNENTDILDILWAIEAPEKLTQSLEKDDFIEPSIPTINIEEKHNKTQLESLTQVAPVIEDEVISEPQLVSKEIVEETVIKTIIEEKKWVSDSFQDLKEEVVSSLNTATQNIKEKNKNVTRLLSAWVFGAKYIITSVWIFSVLLLTTNYSAYSNIAKSYIFEDQIALESQSLLNGVDASHIEETTVEEEVIIKRTKQDRVEELKKQEEETEQIQNQFSIKKLVDKLDKEDVNLDIAIVPYENRIVIPKIWKNIPLIDIQETKVEWKDQLDNIFMKELEEGIVRYPGSAIPGEKWNSFIFGHSSNFPWIAWDYNDVFSRLGQVEVWDIVYSYYGQKKYKYQIKEKKVISPTDVSILKRDKNKSELTLMTCWPIGTTLNRLILIWEIIEE